MRILLMNEVIALGGLKNDECIVKLKPLGFSLRSDAWVWCNSFVAQRRLPVWKVSQPKSFPGSKLPLLLSMK